MLESATDSFSPNGHLSERRETAGYCARNLVILGASQRVLVKRLAAALACEDAVAVIAGRPGIGKSTLVLAAFEVPPSIPYFARIASAPRTIGELLRALLPVVAEVSAGLSDAQLINIWRRTVETERSNERRIVVLVENAQLWCLDALRSLDALTAEGFDGGPDANVVLTGTRAVFRLLNQAPLEPLRERIQLSATLEPMCPATMRQFLEAHIRRAKSGVLLNPGTAELIHAYAGGIPTIAARICDAAISMTAPTHERKLSSATIHHVADTLSAIQNDPVVGRLHTNPNPHSDMQGLPPNTPIRGNSYGAIRR